MYPLIVVKIMYIPTINNLNDIITLTTRILIDTLDCINYTWIYCNNPLFSLKLLLVTILIIKYLCLFI